jgi:hypothetical protein
MIYIITWKMEGNRVRVRLSGSGKLKLSGRVGRGREESSANLRPWY